MGVKGSLLEHLIEMRRTLGAEQGLSRLAGFVDGFTAAQIHLGASDPAAREFFLWLRDVRGEFPPEGWKVKLSRDCGGDEVAAVRRFLDLVVEFVRLKGL